jgi:hypothetical protein
VHRRIFTCSTNETCPVAAAPEEICIVRLEPGLCNKVDTAACGVVPGAVTAPVSLGFELVPPSIGLGVELGVELVPSTIWVVVPLPAAKVAESESTVAADAAKFQASVAAADPLARTVRHHTLPLGSKGSESSAAPPPA